MTDILQVSDPSEPAIPVHAVDTSSLSGVLEQLGETAANWVDVRSYSPKDGAMLAVPDETGRIGAVLFGRTEDAPPSLGAGELAKLPEGRYRLVGPGWTASQDYLAICVGTYRFDRYRTSDNKPPQFLVSPDEDIDDVCRQAEAVTLTRDLINTPANDMSPADLADAIVSLGGNHDAEVNMVIGDKLLEEGFPLVHAVGRAAAVAPRIVDLTWGDASHPKVTLVGKGVCFDTGGLNLKPGNAMALMKKDMGGAANVTGLASMIMSAGLPVRLRLLVPTVENAVSGSAFRPGDVYTARNGKTVEIGNTDAEGRLILADALALADEEAPDLLVDLATLTGAARVALGPDLPPLYSDDDAFAEALATHGHAEADPVWRMPLWNAYDEMLSSPIADVNHISSGGFAGSITAALFLRRFVEEAKTWAHFDIFGWTPSAKPGRPKGGEAQVIRALYAYIRSKYT